MALVYRGIWQDGGFGGGLCEKTTTVFATWASRKWPTLTIPDAVGRTVGAGTKWGNGAELEYSASEASDPAAGILDARRTDLIETWENGSRWHTTLRTWRYNDHSKGVFNWIWVDVEAVGDDAPQIDPVAPGFVTDLLNAGGAASVTGDRLLPEEPNVDGFQRGDELGRV